MTLNFFWFPIVQIARELFRQNSKEINIGIGHWNVSSQDPQVEAEKSPSFNNLLSVDSEVLIDFTVPNIKKNFWTLFFSFTKNTKNLKLCVKNFFFGNEVEKMPTRVATFDPAKICKHKTFSPQLYSNQPLPLLENHAFRVQKKAPQTKEPQCKTSY